MSNTITGFAVVMITLILFLIFIAFIFLWLASAKKEKTLAFINANSKIYEKKKSIKDQLWVYVHQLIQKMEPTSSKINLLVKPERDERYLILAGRPRDLSVKEFYSLRLVLWFLAFMGGALYFMLGMPFRLFVFIFIPVFAFFAPHIWIRWKAKERQESISASMPDFLDIASVSLQAGSSLDGALRQVAGNMEGPLSEEIQQLNREISFGVPRDTAYNNLLSRNSAEELEILIQSLIQGGELGVPVSRTFRVQAEDLRANRGYKAKEQAAKASPKITVITTFTIVPSVFILIMGLLVLNFMYNPEAFGLGLLNN